jgi:hypothetical protein
MRQLLVSPIFGTTQEATAQVEIVQDGIEQVVPRHIFSM